MVDLRKITFDIEFASCAKHRLEHFCIYEKCLCHHKAPNFNLLDLKVSNLQF